MRGYERLKGLDDATLKRLVIKTYSKVHDRMTATSNRSGLIYGWDWPTARVLYPILTSTHLAVAKEGRARGLK